MKTVDIRLELKKHGAIHNGYVFLEKNEKIGFWLTDPEKGILYRDLNSYPVEGALDVKMNVTGKNGASATLTIKIKGQEQTQLICTINNGFSSEEKSISIN